MKKPGPLPLPINSNSKMIFCQYVASTGFRAVDRVLAIMLHLEGVATWGGGVSAGHLPPRALPGIKGESPGCACFNGMGSWFLSGQPPPSMVVTNKRLGAKDR